MHLNYACKAVKLLLNGLGITIAQSNRRSGLSCYCCLGSANPGLKVNLLFCFHTY